VKLKREVKELKAKEEVVKLEAINNNIG